MSKGSAVDHSLNMQEGPGFDPLHCKKKKKSQYLTLEFPVHFILFSIALLQHLTYYVLVSCSPNNVLNTFDYTSQHPLTWA
jgi:hypothetical protein